MLPRNSFYGVQSVDKVSLSVFLDSCCKQGSLIDLFKLRQDSMYILGSEEFGKYIATLIKYRTSIIIYLFHSILKKSGLTTAWTISK